MLIVAIKKNSNSSRFFYRPSLRLGNLGPGGLLQIRFA
jgi:hypothetical protein